MRLAIKSISQMRRGAKRTSAGISRKEIVGGVATVSIIIPSWTCVVTTSTENATGTAVATSTSPKPKRRNSKGAGFCLRMFKTGHLRTTTTTTTTTLEATTAAAAGRATSVLTVQCLPCLLHTARIKSRQTCAEILGKAIAGVVAAVSSITQNSSSVEIFKKINVIGKIADFFI